MNPSLYDLLYRSFDDTLSEAERRRLEDALASSPALRDEHNRLVQLRQMVSDSAVGSFKPWFAERVLARIMTKEARETDLFFTALYAMFRRVVIATVVAILITVTYNLVQSGTISFAATFGFQEEPTLEEMLDVTVALESEGAL